MKTLALDFSQLSQPEIYKLLIGAIVPRPIAFVSTVSAEGVGNLAPFSFFNAVSSYPPCLMISIARKSTGEKKDTLKNIEETGTFVVNCVSEWMVEPMNQASADYPYGVDEMAQVGLTAIPSVKVKASRVKEAAIQMECEVYRILEIGDGLSVGSTTLVVGRILLMHVAEAVYDQGKIRIDALKPIARLAGSSYSKLGEVFDLARPKI